MLAREACRGCFLVCFLQQTVCLLLVVSMRVWGWSVGGGGGGGTEDNRLSSKRN